MKYLCIGGPLNGRWVEASGPTYMIVEPDRDIPWTVGKTVDELLEQSIKVRHSRYIAERIAIDGHRYIVYRYEHLGNSQFLLKCHEQRNTLTPTLGKPEVRREVTVVGNTSIMAVVGYRCWLVTKQGGRLRSVFPDLTWEPNAYITAEVCSSRIYIPGVVPNEPHYYPHSAPAHQCSCGIHAFATAEQLAGYGDRHIVGEVHLWGDVAVHEQGFRARHARVSAIYANESGYAPYEQTAAVIAERYGIPLVQSPLAA